MTGDELRNRAIGGERGWPVMDMLPKRVGGLWARAAWEVTHLEEKVAHLEEKLARLSPSALPEEHDHLHV